MATYGLEMMLGFQALEVLDLLVKIEEISSESSFPVIKFSRKIFDVDGVNGVLNSQGSVYDCHSANPRTFVGDGTKCCTNMQ